MPVTKYVLRASMRQWSLNRKARLSSSGEVKGMGKATRPEELARDLAQVKESEEKTATKSSATTEQPAAASSKTSSKFKTSEYFTIATFWRDSFFNGEIAFSIENSDALSSHCTYWKLNV